MNQPLLDEGWRDIVSVVSFIVTAGGFLVTIVMVIKTKKAAVLAKETTESVAAEMKGLVHKHEIETAHHFFQEAKIYVQHENWEGASIRLRDLAKAVARINLLGSDEWTNIIDDAREWAHQCQRVSDSQLAKLPPKKWLEFLSRVEGEIDRFHGPFQKANLESES